MDSPMSRALNTAVWHRVQRSVTHSSTLHPLTHGSNTLEVVPPVEDEGRRATHTRPHLTHQPGQQELDNEVYHCDGEGEGVTL